MARPGLRRFGEPVAGTALALLSFALAALLRAWLNGSLPPGFPFLTFFPAVIGTAYLAGWRPAALCATLSTLAAWLWFIPPAHTLRLDPPTALALVFFIFVAGFIIWAVHQLQVAVDRIEAEQQTVTRLYDGQRTMFQELQHRISNNMMFVAALLSLHRREIVNDPDSAVRLIDEARQRLATMSRIHRKLYDPAASDMPLDRYFGELAHDLLDATGARNIVAMVETGDCRIGVERLMTLSMLATEVMTNSLKHAFVGRDRGTISLSLKAGAADRLTLMIADDGIGKAVPAPDRQPLGLGTRIIESLVRQLGGELTVDSSPSTGTRTLIDFAAA